MAADTKTGSTVTVAVALSRPGGQNPPLMTRLLTAKQQCHCQWCGCALPQCRAVTVPCTAIHTQQGCV